MVVFVFTDQSFDGGGFSCPACTNEEYVVGRFTENESARVADELFLLALIADNVLHTRTLKVVDAADVMCCTVPTEHGIGRHISTAIAGVEC